jgi:hypothetical protein
VEKIDICEIHFSADITTQTRQYKQLKVAKTMCTTIDIKKYIA